MPWPLASHFSTMVQQPRVAFRDPRLQACRIERNAFNQPRVWAGQFAVVYKGLDPQGKAVAIRAFIRESSDRREHYDRISEHLKTRPLRCLVDFGPRRGHSRPGRTLVTRTLASLAAPGSPLFLTKIDGAAAAASDLAGILVQAGFIATSRGLLHRGGRVEP